jgi:hypothetical protein
LSALLLYAIATLAILFVWNRWIQPLSRAVAIVLFLLPFCFTGRALLTDRVYAPIDLPFMAEPLHAYRGDYDIGEPHNPQLSDLYQQIIPWNQAVRKAWKHGEWPLLNPYMLCGDILAGAAQPAPYDPFNLLALLIATAPALTFGASMTFFLAAFSAFAFAHAIGCRDAAAFVAAAGWMCSTNMAFFAGWPIARSWALFPLVLFCVRAIVREPSLRSAALLAVTLVVLIFTGHPESLLHIVAIGVVYALFLRPPLRSIGLACASGIVAFGITAIFLLPFLEAAPQSSQHELRQQNAHAKVYAPPDWIAKRTRAWLLPWKERDADNGGSGLVLIALSLAALILARRRSETWFFFALATICVFIGVNAPPFANLIHKLPGFNMAINDRMIFAADFSLAILAALAVDTTPAILQCVFVALVLIERLIEVGSFYPTLPRGAFYPKTPTIAAIPKSDEPFRIAALSYQLIPDAAVFYGLEDVRGYSAMNNKRLSATSALWCYEQPVSFNRIDDFKKPFLSFLNVRYLLTPMDYQPQLPQWKLLATDKGGKVYENLQVVPRAFVPGRIRYQTNSTDILYEMFGADDFASRAWIEVPEYKPAEIINGPGQLTTRRAKLGYDIDANMQHAGWIVISQTAWNGWRAYVDDHRVKLRYANHAFLGVHVDAGRHRVKLVYLPDSFTRGRAISFTTLALVAISALSRSAIRARRRAPRPA